MHNKLLIIVANVLLFNLTCIAQVIEDKTQCNQQSVDNSIARLIPDGVCLPDGYTADLVVKDFDFNQDRKMDLAIRFIKYPLQDGNMQNYQIFEQLNDTVYSIKKELVSLRLPYIKFLTASYRESHPLADSLARQYPLDTQLAFNSDSISVSHLIQNFFGKTYIFIYDNSTDNWHLQSIRYWLGELPLWLVRNADLREELLYERIYLEDKKPDKQISIDEFDLIESKRIADTEESPYLMNKYDIFELGAKKQK
jgi:hypothetical protein